jgi:hypothetical protein
MINWKSLGFGIALAVVMYFLFIFNVQSLALLSFIIAPLIGGYIVGGNLKIGAVHGAIIDFVGSIIAILLFAALISYFSNTAISLGIINIISLIAIFIIYAGIGAVFGVIGAFIKNKLLEKQ